MVGESNDRLQLRAVMLENDRRGERAIAGFQALIAVIVFGFHLVSASKNQWSTFGPLTIGVATAILAACGLRLWLADRARLPAFALNVLTVIDGLLIFALIISYSYAYDLPLESSFKAPSVIFLVLYTCARVFKLDPVPVIVSGATVVAGWIGLLAYTVANGADVTNSYRDHATSGKLLIGANIEMATGYLAVIVVLAATCAYARRILAETADVNELQAAKLAAESAVARHSALFNASTDGMVVVDDTGIIERVNPAMEAMFGFSSQDLIGNSVAMLMSQEDAMKLANDIALFKTSKTSNLVGRPFESQGLKNGTVAFPIELSISNFEVAGKLHFTGIVRDISARLQAQISERSALLKFEEVVTSALDAIVVIDERGMIVEFNPAAEEIFGFKRSDVIGKELSATIVPQHHRSAHRNGMMHYLKTGEGPVLNQRIEIDAVTANGLAIMIELAIKEFETNEGRFFFGYMRDITAKKAGEVELVKAKERAEIANRAKASFLAMMSHEIRTPLNGVLGVLSLLTESVKQPENIKLITTARRSGRALLSIINDILDFSKLEAGKLDLEIASFNTELLLDSVYSLVRQQAAQKGISFSFETAEGVPKFLKGDQDRIRQIMLNLVWNAIKFTEEGSVRLVVSNCGRRQKPGIRFEVIDTGIGVPDDRKGELFAEFATIDPGYARKFGGTGLGLSICKALTDMMGGQIGYLKNQDGGSTFWFELPLTEGEETEFHDEDTEAAARSVLSGRGKVRLLLAEDNVTNQLVVGNMLERLGCVVDIAGNGQEAIDSVCARDYDAVLMDVSMPEMDGITATKVIRKLGGKAGQIPIIALTAYALDEDRQRVLAAGMSDFVAKPISRIELARAIARQISGRDQDTDAEAVLRPSSVQALFDEPVLEAILAGMDEAMGTRVLIELDNDIRRHLEAMAVASGQQDAVKFENATHGLKGVSGTFGATELSNLASQANTLVRNGETEKAFAMSSGIEKLALACLRSVRQRFGAAGGPKE